MTGLTEYNNDNLNRVTNYITAHPAVQGYYNYLRTDKSLTTIYMYLQCVQHFLDYAKKEGKDLTFDDYTSFLAYASVKEDGSQITSGAIIQKYHALKNYNTYLVEAGMASRNYMQSIKRPKPIESQATLEKRAKSYLTKEEIQLYLKRVKEGIGTDHAKIIQQKMKERDIAIIMIFLTTGIRKSAMVKLDVNNVDFQNATLWVTDKGSKVHPYKLNTDTLKAIRRWLYKRTFLLHGKNTTALFVNQYGDRLKRCGISEIVTKYAADIQGKHITPHKLRATYGTQLYEATKDIYFVQKAMGHNSPTTTERYVRGQDEVTKEASDIMGRLF